MASLPGCNCINCQRWMAERPPDPISQEEAALRRTHWEEYRKAWKAANPAVPKKG